jgi:glycosyltransferase involved in cell wall biosynthesis
MVCSILPIKRVYEVVLAIYELRQEGYPFTLHIAGMPGEGEHKRYIWALEDLVESLGLAHAVQFCGHVTEVADWLQDIDVFISNSYWEGQQVALIEAMACGCYCVGHCWKGIEEILPPDNICVTDGELRAKLIAYAALPEAAQQAAQSQMRAIAEAKFDEQRMVREIVELIEQVART